MTDTAQTAWCRLPPLSLVQAVQLVFRKAFVFSGRARPAEFWKFLLFWLVVNLALIIIWSSTVGPKILTAQAPAGDGTTRNVIVGQRYDGGWLANVFNLICLIPILSVTSRRLHDLNRSSWWMVPPVIWPFVLSAGIMIAVIGFAPVIEAVSSGLPIRVRFGGFPFAIYVILLFAPAIFLFTQLARRGTPGPNRFGPNPIEVTK